MKQSFLSGVSGVRILQAGVAGGLVDCVYATVRGMLQSGSATAPWRSVASGWLGRAAQEGGGAVLLGLATHFAIAMLMAAVWVTVFARQPFVRRHLYPAAVGYGLALYVVMYLIVLPLRWPSVFPRWDGVVSVLDVLAHVAAALAFAFVAADRPRTCDRFPTIVSG